MARTKSDAPETGEFTLALSTNHLLHRAQQLASDRFTYLVGEDGVTLRQFAVLAAVAETPGLSQAELVRATGVDRSTLADMMSRMEKRGWVERSASQSDGRANAVTLAPDGRTLLDTALNHAKAADAAILDALPKSKRKTFHATLLLLSQLIDRAAEKAEQNKQREKEREDKKKLRAEAKKITTGDRKRKRKHRARSGSGKRGSV